MPNITMTIDDKLLKKARKAAIDKNQSLTSLIRDYLEKLTQEEESTKKRILSELKTSFKRSKCVVGKKTWKREGLYDR